MNKLNDTLTATTLIFLVETPTEKRSFLKWLKQCPEKINLIKVETAGLALKKK